MIDWQILLFVFMFGVGIGFLIKITADHYWYAREYLKLKQEKEDGW